MPSPLAAMIGGTVASTAVGVYGANKAASTQAKATGQAVDAQREAMDRAEQLSAPYRQAGEASLGGILFELGLGDKPEGYEGYSLSPMARYGLETGLETVGASAVSRGSMNSGAALRAMEDLRYRTVTADRGEYFDRLTGLAGMGQASAAGQTMAGQTFAANAGNALMAGGQAQAQGIIGGANAVNAGIGNMANIYGYMNPMQAYTQNFGVGKLFGGNSWG